MTPYTFGFIYHQLPKPVNAWRGLHWRFRHAEDKKWKKIVGQLLLAHRKPAAPLKRAKLKLTRFSSVCPDSDGLTSSFKAVLDALVHNGVLEDDSFKHIGMPEYRWEKASPKQGRIEVMVEEVPDGQAAV
jgi:Holliday junction resolvase RusA-like endonuclease